MAGYIGSKASVVSSGAERKKVFDITTTTTSLTGCSYTPNQVHVFHNGVRLVDGTDYTATDGSTVTLTTAAQSGDEVVVISYATFQTSDTVSASAGGTFSNAVTVDADDATVLTVDRATSYGPLIELQRNGSTFADIGVASFSGTSVGRPYFTNHSEDGLGIHYINSSNAAIVPIRANAEIDDAGYLGHTNHRWKDLYLSGGVYLGGTGAANYLDDYEEGTWTVQYTDNSGNTSSTTDTGYYTKIGSQVTATFSAANVDTTGLVGTDALFYTLPFTVNAYQAYGSVRLYADVLTGTVSLVAQSSTGNARGSITQSRDNATLQSLDVNQLISGASDFGVTITYFTDA